MHVPLRSCIACRRSAAKRELVRLVVAQDAVQVDPTGSHPGRGAYLCGLMGCVETALRRDGAVIRRALRLSNRDVTLDVDTLRARLCEMEDARSSATTRKVRQVKRPALAGDSPRPRPAEGVSA